LLCTRLRTLVDPLVWFRVPSLGWKIGTRIDQHVMFGDDRNVVVVVVVVVFAVKSAGQNRGNTFVVFRQASCVSRFIVVGFVIYLWLQVGMFEKDLDPVVRKCLAGPGLGTVEQKSSRVTQNGIWKKNKVNKQSRLNTQKEWK